jgi:hypothetical protein
VNNEFLKEKIDAINDLAGEIDNHIMDNCIDGHDYGYIKANIDTIKNICQDIYYLRNLFKK